MSEESAKAFLKKVGEDKDLQEKLKGADSEEKYFAVVEAAGFEFTKEELASIAPEDELSEDQLAATSGGQSTYGEGNTCGPIQAHCSHVNTLARRLGVWVCDQCKSEGLSQSDFGGGG